MTDRIFIDEARRHTLYLCDCAEHHADKFPAPDHIRRTVGRIRAALTPAPQDQRAEAFRTVYEPYPGAFDHLLGETPAPQDQQVEAVGATDILREWFGADRYARDREYLDANFMQQAQHIVNFLTGTHPSPQAEAAPSRDEALREVAKELERWGANNAMPNGEIYDLLDKLDAALEDRT